MDAASAFTISSTALAIGEAWRLSMILLTNSLV
jgi:hypothetical protein